MLGSPRLLTDASGATVGSVSFDAFGNRASSAGKKSAFGFTGNWTDSDTGLVYLRARDYDPATGQFLSVDPAVDVTKQPYAYAGNNPISRTDPTGLDYESDNPLVDFVETVNPVSQLLNGGANLGKHIDNGCDIGVIAGDIVDIVFAVADLASIAIPGAGLATAAAKTLFKDGVMSFVKTTLTTLVAGGGRSAVIDADSGNYVWRALTASDRESVDAGLGVTAKNPAGSWSLGEHIASGSGRASLANDPWIATSRGPSIAAAFDSGYGVIRINLDLVDSLWEEAWKIYPRVNGADGVPFHFSFWQQEVSIQRFIPAGAIE